MTAVAKRQLTFTTGYIFRLCRNMQFIIELSHNIQNDSCSTFSDHDNYDVQPEQRCPGIPSPYFLQMQEYSPSTSQRVMSVQELMKLN